MVRGAITMDPKPASLLSNIAIKRVNTFPITKIGRILVNFKIELIY